MSSEPRAEYEDTVAATGPTPGTVLDDRYEIIEPLGEGGMGEVYRAQRLKLGLQVAIKVLRHTAAADGETRLRFEREARAMAALAHPNIVSVTDFGVYEGRPYLVMELLEGQTLRARTRDVLLPIEHLDHIMTQFLQGLAYAHSQGLVHRDLKPENLFLQALPDQLPHVKILDFGFAKFLGDGGHGPTRDLTRSGVVFGTPTYMSPEQAVGDTMDVRTDVYAAGVILYEILSGHKPFTGDYVEVRKKKLTQEVPPLSETCPTLRPQPELVELLMAALSKDRAGRPDDAGAFLEAFGRVPRPIARRSAGRSLHPASVIPAAVSIWGQVKALPRPVLGAVGGALALLLLYLVASGGDDAPQSPQDGPAQASDDAPQGTDVTVAAAPEQPQNAAPTGAQDEGARAEPAEQMVIGLEELKTQAEPARPDPARPKARNPWARGKLPARISRIYKRSVKGQKVSAAAEKAVREYAQGHRSDPRPSLLLAYIYANRAWFSDAITRYRLAIQIDPSARGDARMRKDLLLLSRSRSKLGSPAADAIAEIYGSEAVPWVERSIKRDRLTEQERKQLLRLRDRLAAL